MCRMLTLLAALAAFALPALAGESQQAGGGPVLLYVQSAGGSEEGFGLDDLRQLPAVTFRTETIWTSGPQEFTGVPLAALVRRLGVTDGVLEAHAINDYAVQIPVSDAVDGGPIVAYERNGAPMSVRDKGPLWIVYPYDSDPDYKTEAVYSRSIWQLERIIVKP